MKSYLQANKARILSTLAQLAVVISVSVAAGLFLNGRLQARSVRLLLEQIVPYTLAVRETLHKEDGSIVLLNERVEARRSDGATVIRRIPFHALGQEEIGVERSVSFPSGLDILINEKWAIKTSAQRKAVSLASTVRDPTSNCLRSYAGKVFAENEVLDGEEVVAGYKTVRIKAGGVVRWLALEHGCARVRDRIEWGPGKGANETNLLSLNGGEPEASLFDTADSLREVPPSERMRILIGKTCPDCLDRQKERLLKADASYFNNRPK